MSSYDTKRIFSENLVNRLTEQGRTQLELSRALKVAPSSVSSWCSGEKMPRMDKVERIAAYLGVSTTDLLSDPASAPEEESLKAALWGGERELSREELDLLWADVREYAAFKAQQLKKRKQ